MFVQVITLLKNNRMFFNLSLGFLLTSIGSGLTQIAIYGWLGENTAKPLSFAFTFAFSILPSLFSTQIGVFLSRKYNLFLILAFIEILGALSIGITGYGIYHSTQWIIIASILLPSFCGGLAMAPYSVIVKKHFTNDDFPVVSAIETITFSATVFLGTGLGAILYPIIPIPLFLIIDFLSYFAAVYCIFNAKNATYLNEQYQSELHNPEKKIPFQMRSLSGKKLRAFALMPLLACITTPAMALLPSLGLKFNTLLESQWISPVILLIFSRSIGQMIGPLVLNPKTVTKLFSDTLIIPLLCAGFLISYFIVFQIRSLLLICFIVVFAHILSNIIFTATQSALFRYFNEYEIASASVRSNQIQLFIMATFGVLAGTIADYYGPTISMVIISIPCLVILCWGFWLSLRSSYEQRAQ